MGLIAFIVVGLIIGLVARAIVPGTQSMGILATTALGIIGSFIGGLASSVIYAHTNWSQLHTPSLLFSLGGAVLLLVAVGGFGRRVRG